METAEGKSVAKESDDGISRNDDSVNLTPSLIPKAGKSSEIVAEEPNSSEQHQRQELSLNIPKATMEQYIEDSVVINMPHSPIRTPKRVNYSPLPSPNWVKVNESPDPSSSRGITTRKILLPKLNFKFRNSNSEIEKAAMLALGANPDMRAKTSIPRTFSLTKIFTPKIKRTSSLPVSPIFHSNPESTHGGIINTPVDLAVSTSFFTT